MVMMISNYLYVMFRKCVLIIGKFKKGVMTVTVTQGVVMIVKLDSVYCLFD